MADIYEALARRCAAAEDRARARCVKRAEVRLDASEIRALLARIAAVEALRQRLWSMDNMDVRPGWPKQMLDALDAALAASPTPTGPEPATCEHGETEAHDFWRNDLHRNDRRHCPCPGPATPTEPTEETP